MPKATEEPVWSALNRGYTGILVAALMLPVSGALVRFVSLGRAEVTDRASLAVTLPLGELAAVGLVPVILTVLTIGAADFLAKRAYSRLREQSGHQSPGYSAEHLGGEVPAKPKRRRGSFSYWFDAATLAGSFAIVFLSVVVLGWAYLLLFIAFMFVLIVTRARVRLGLGLTSAWMVAAIAVAYAATALLYGMTPPPASIGVYTFTPDSGISSGAFARLAQSDSMIFLGPCATRGGVLGVSPVTILHVEWPKPGQSDPLARLRAFIDPASDFYLDCP